MSGAGLSGAEMCLLRLANGIIQAPENIVIVLNTEEGILNEKLRELGIIVYVQPCIYVKRIYRIHEILQLFKNIFAFKRIISKEKPDIIHAFTLPLARRIILFKKIGIKTPIVGTTHDTLTIEHFGKHKIKLFTKSINKNYERLISVSEANSRAAIKNGIVEKKVRVIYNGIPSKYLTNQFIKSDAFVIGNFGRIVFGKGQHVTIEAVNILINAIPKLKCYIIGEPAPGVSGSIEYYKSLKKSVVDNKIEKYVEFITWTDGLDTFYEKLNVYILSSISPDSFPTVNLEAMQHKLPVIATSIGGSKEQIVDGVTGFIIPPNDPVKLAEKLLFLYKNPYIAFMMGEEGYKRVLQYFNLEIYVTKHLELYKSVIKINR
jgi:glycosyltransferase involved in cell wall biosynthesis